MTIGIRQKSKCVEILGLLKNLKNLKYKIKLYSYAVLKQYLILLDILKSLIL